MIITRTPFRISFFGGGTDYPQWYDKHGGQVLSTTINKYCYILLRNLPPFFRFDHVIRYSEREEVKWVSEIKHPSVRACFVYAGVKGGLEVVHTGDIPAKSGIGSSSAFTVGLLHALYGLQGNIVTKRKLADAALHVEQHIIEECVGSQDQVACVFGGFNKIEFNKQGFYVKPLTLKEERLKLLEGHLMLFFTGFSRQASEIAKSQVQNFKVKNATLKSIHDMVDEAIGYLNTDIISFGKLLHESWELKKNLSSKISTDEIDNMYNIALRKGAIGGKLLGAGGGGFLLIFAEPKKHKIVEKALVKQGAVYVPFDFESLGSQIIHYSTIDNNYD
tara:strand:- start:12726 stop:13724 length:999 start_codon:yes stop_codon:yes gene_type:complete